MKIKIFLILFLPVWSICKGQNKTTFAYDIKGNMTKLAFTGTNNCTSSLQSKASVAVEQNKAAIRETQLSVYPSPASTTVTIHFTVATDGLTTIEVYDALGHKLQHAYTGFVEKGTYFVQYNVQAMAQGVYLCVLKNNSQTIVQKFIKTN